VVHVTGEDSMIVSYIGCRKALVGTGPFLSLFA